MKYEEYLKTEHWIEFAKSVRNKRKRCADCGLGRTWCRWMFRQNINVHHLTYENLGNEKETDVVLLCVACHAARHGLPAPPMFTVPEPRPEPTLKDIFSFDDPYKRGFPEDYEEDDDSA